MNYLKKHSRDIVFVGVILVCVLLLGFSILIVNRYTAVLDDQVATRVESYSLKTEGLVSARLQTFKDYALYASGKLRDHTEEEDFRLSVRNLRTDGKFLSVKAIYYYNDGKFYEETSKEFTEPPAALVDLVARGGNGSSSVFLHKESNMNLIAFCAPVTSNKNIEYIILCYTEDILSTVASEVQNNADIKAELEMAKLVVLSTENGQILKPVHDPDSLISGPSNIFDVLNKRVDSADISSRLSELIVSGQNGCIGTSINGEAYSVGMVQSDSAYGIYVVSLYKSSEAYSAGYTFIAVIVTTVIILFIIMICYAVFFILSRRKVNQMLQEFGTKDPKLGCPTLLGIERLAPGILKQYRSTKFVVAVVELKHFNYIREQVGPSAADEILTYVYRSMKKSLNQAELLGYLGDNEFILLLHYKDLGVLTNRLRTISFVFSDSLSAKTYDINMVFGVCEIERTPEGNFDLHQTVSSATIAKNSAGENIIGNNIIFFNDVFKEVYMKNADVEIKMEAALNAGEFRIFFQPKVNLHTNRCDGCEALVRWYDSQKDYYRPPDSFLPLFEENGFIVKLDKYVYHEVCKFIRDRVASGRRVYPVSVNISRLTALAPDFLDYYINIKKQFHIPDNFIMLEFTENIAHESYEKLNHISQVLHRNGFHCSIDDFGSGYSSFNILKNMEMDEIKLDKIFLEKGLSNERDKVIWESVIALGHSLNLKVTQEGVETQEIMNYMRSVGCDVIQGYFYSRPMPMEDFQRFTDKCVEEEKEEDALRMANSYLGQQPNHT